MMYGHYSCKNWRHWQLSPSLDMLAIQFWDCYSFLDNLQIAMLMEAVGVGPQRYSICFDPSLDTYRNLKLVYYSLPQEKMFIYLANATVEGPFLHEPWLSMTRVIQSRPSLTREEYVANFHTFLSHYSSTCTFVYMIFTYMILYSGYVIQLLEK